MAGLAAAPAAAMDRLPAAARAALQRAEVPEDALTGVAWPLDGWRWGAHWARDADRPMQPGSTMKLLTTAVALDRLGPNLRGRTQLLSAAPVVDGVLQGDLALRGGADPELGWPQLWQLLLELREQGVQAIGGDILLDRSLFRPARIDQGLPPFDEAPDFPYNVIPDALMLAGHLLGLELRDTPDGVQARTMPRLDGLSLQAAFTRTDAPCSAWSRGWQPPRLEDDGRQLRLWLSGDFPRGCTVRPALQLIDRDRLAELGLRTLWTQLGGRLQGGVRPGLAPAGARVLAERLSRPWGEVLRTMNKQSDNTLTRLLFLQLGVAAMADDPQRTTAELAAREVHRWLAEQGIDDRGLVLDNGSGLSRRERLTPRLLARVIETSLAGRHGPELLMSLPTVGVDGTMRNRLKDSPAAGWARLKTGTLRNVAGLAGIVPDARGRHWVVVVLVNHERAAQARPALDALIDWIARGQPTEAGPDTGIGGP